MIPTTVAEFLEVHMTAENNKRIAARERKRKQRAKVPTVDKPVCIQIKLTREEYLELVALESQARDPVDFRTKAFMQGARFRANTGRGRDKIKCR